MKIDFYNLYKQDNKKHKIIINKFKKIINKGDFILGDEVHSFEKRFSKFIGSKYAISCANGTDAITLALKSLKLPKNSEVIIPAMTYCSTAFAIINAGLKPILVDVSNKSPTIDPEQVKKKINKNTKVIMPVHLYGCVSDLKKIKEYINKFKKKIFVVDDCAQAHGAIDHNSNKLKKVGNTTDISCFSFYPGKNIGAYGDAGILTTNNNKIQSNLKRIRNLGSLTKFDHNIIGFNSRMDSLQAAVLNSKINNLKKYNYKRRNIAKLYDKLILNSKIQKLNYSKYSVYHQYVILVNNRKAFSKYLAKNNIGFGYHYPQALHQHLSLKKKFKNQKYKNAEKIAKNGISLPIDPSLTYRQIKYIIKKINQFN